MSDFESYDCEDCGETFVALAGSNAAENGSCSPKCEVEGNGLD